jgi:hypothetical protein
MSDRRQQIDPLYTGEDRRSGQERRKRGRKTLSETERLVNDIRLKLNDPTYNGLCRLALKFDLDVTVIARRILERETIRLSPAISRDTNSSAGIPSAE